MTNITVVQAIVKAHFIATLAQVETLAHDVVAGQNADGTYLRVLLAHMQSKLGRPRRGKQPPQEPVLDTVHEALYPSILKGVANGDEITDTERNRRATFARSAASTVRTFIRGGGDVRSIDVATATKAGLRAAVAPPAPEVAEGATRTQRSYIKAEDAYLRSVQRLARGDPEDARERVEGLMEQLEKLLAELDAPPAEHGATTTIVGRSTAPRGAPAVAPQLHRGA